MARAKKPPLVEVVWVDAVSDENVHGVRGHVLKSARLWIRETGGYLIHQDGEDVPALMRRTILVHDYDRAVEPGKEDEYGNTTTIPSGWVVKIKHVRRARAKKVSPDVKPES